MIGYSVALLCLSLNNYQEAGNQPLVGKEAQIDVVVQRSLENGTDVCTEVLRPHQFSWIVGKHNIAYLKAEKRKLLHKIKSNQAEMNAWNESVTMAALVLSKSSLRFHFDSYHTTSVHPKWAKHRHEVRIGDHLFSRNSKCSKQSCSSHASQHVELYTLKETHGIQTQALKQWLQQQSALIPPLPRPQMVTQPLQPVWETVQPSRQSTVNIQSSIIGRIIKWLK